MIWPTVGHETQGWIWGSWNLLNQAADLLFQWSNIWVNRKNVHAEQIHNLDDKLVTGGLFLFSPSQAGKVYVPGNSTSTLLRSERPFQSVSELQERNFFWGHLLICGDNGRNSGRLSDFIKFTHSKKSTESNHPWIDMFASWYFPLTFHWIDWIKTGTYQSFDENESQAKLRHWGTNQCLMNICSCSCLFGSDSEQIEKRTNSD